MGLVTTSSENLFVESPETVYDFVSNPNNWIETYDGCDYVGELGELPLQVGDKWKEGLEGGGYFTWQLAIATRPTIWEINSVGRLGHDCDGIGGMEGRITIQYRFTKPEPERTLFARTMTIELPKHVAAPDEFFAITNPAKIYRFYTAVARQLAR